ncbi:hypothetical protein GLW04_17240 [Halobacillus litoralis]|uniref:Uncharacterized protein n=1 Tax=Halobacillus litoralis TaxID=45668 RepID=A0A845DZ99_9BACI|nr:hypothetical protein [Halobacillus litoralis]MYL21652.1 hypothetical protein [Halobacillus litoralis]
MEGLKLFHTYTRKEVHDLFDPESNFLPSRGAWGLHGIIKLPIPNDFVFFVTLGHSEGTYEFNENIEDTGKLNWQSQPKQKLSHLCFAREKYIIMQ